MTPPTPTHTHVWDGTRTLPDWLTNHRWTAGQLVIRTPDGDTRPQAGWWLIAWSDGTITAASPTSGERVYGADGITGQLARAEYELNRHAEAEANDIAAGSYAGRVEELQAALARVRAECAALARDLQDAEDDGMRAALTRIRAALDARPADDTPPGAVPDGTSVIGPPPGISADEARQMRDDLLAVRRPTAPAGLRDRLVGLHAFWVRSGPPPLGASISRWWDRRLAEFGTALGEQPGTHVYLSTGCLHGDHTYCQSMTGLNGTKRPGVCKHCQAKCTCSCHQTKEN